MGLPCAEPRGGEASTYASSKPVLEPSTDNPSDGWAAEVLRARKRMRGERLVLDRRRSRCCRAPVPPGLVVCLSNKKSALSIWPSCW
jgi:hypothetical protein